MVTANVMDATTASKMFSVRKYGAASAVSAGEIRYSCEGGTTNCTALFRLLFEEANL